MGAVKYIPLQIGGSYSGGTGFDPASIPDGKSLSNQNFLNRGGAWIVRPTWGASLANVRGVATWEDQTNDRSTLVLFTGTGSALTMNLQDAAADTFSTTVAGVTGPSVYDHTNYHGQLVMSAGTKIYAYNGTSVTADALGGETVYSDSITNFIDRIFMGRLHVTIANQLTVAQSYDPTTSWATSNVTAEKITNGSVIVGRITPTNDTTASLYLKDIYTVSAATKDTFLRYWCDLRNTSAIYAVPVKIEAYYSQAWVSGATYAVGHIRVPTAATGNGYRYRVTSITTGVAAAGEPSWPTTVGTTVVDGGVTWICDGTDACGSLETTIANTSDEPNFTRNSVLVRVAPNPQSTKIGIRIVYGNTGSTTYTLTSLEMSLRDGKTDGLPDKANFGQQLTVGRFGYDFFNQESSASATVTHDDRVYWTETADMTDLRGNGFYRCQERAGLITAIAAIAGRLIVFKQRGMWVFTGTADPDNPIRLESFNDAVGCLSPKTLTVFDNTLYFSGIDEIYSWRPGAEAKPLCGDAMRETIFAKVGSTQYRPVAMAYDQHNKELWVITGRNAGFYYTYNTNTDSWSLGTQPFAFVQPTSPVTAWSVSTRSIYISDGRGVGASACVLNGTTSTDTGSGSGLTAAFTPRYTTAPAGSLYVARNLWVRYRGATSSTANTLKMSAIYWAYDTVVAKTATVEVPDTSSSSAPQRLKFPIDQTAHTFAISLTWQAGSSSYMFALSSAVLEVEEIPDNLPMTGTFVSTTL